MPEKKFRKRNKKKHLSFLLPGAFHIQANETILNRKEIQSSLLLLLLLEAFGAGG
jgi:hypothetical protein